MSLRDQLRGRYLNSSRSMPERFRSRSTLLPREAAFVRTQRRLRSRLSTSTSLLLLVAAALVVIAACAGRRTLDELPTQLFVGHYTGGEGGSWFRRCGAEPSDSAWWVTFTDAAVAQRDSLRREGEFLDTPLFVRWRAAMTEGGEVGPRGPGVPALLVRDIIEVRARAQGDCST